MYKLSITVGILHSMLNIGSRPTGRPALHYKDVCKGDLKAGGFDPSNQETAALDCSGWHSTTQTIIKKAEERRDSWWGEKRLPRQQRLQLAPLQTQGQGQKPAFTCSIWNRQCSSCIGLYSHTWCCSSIKWSPWAQTAYVCHYRCSQNEQDFEHSRDQRWGSKFSSETSWK